MIDDTLKKVLDIGIAFSKEHDRVNLLDRILMAAINLTGCDGGTLYMNEDNSLKFRIMVTKSLGIHQGGNGEPVKLPPVPLSKSNVCACGVLYRKLINIPDVYESDMYDFSGPRRYDAMTGYKTTSMMVVPMEDDKGNVIGVMQLINALDEQGQVIPFEEEYEQILLSLGSQAAICLVNMNYSEKIENMLNAFVKVMSTAIDARTPYNVNHSKNMAAYASRFIDWLNRQDMGWKFDEETERVFLMSIWLHDVGKLVISKGIMDKSDRLGSNYRALMDRLSRISLLTRLAEFEGRITSEEKEDTMEKLDWAKNFIEKMNTTYFLSPELEKEVHKLDGLTYVEEDGTICSWITQEEMQQLLIKKGTLTEAERKEMQRHVVMTEKLLEQMNFTDEYRNVLVWTSKHHELLNGNGYPKGLKGEEIPKEVRLLTILDVFEALTAKDRPYKPPKEASQALNILHGMAEDGEIDIEILKLFEESRAWEDIPMSQKICQSLPIK